MARTQVQSELLATNSISGTIIADNAITATHIATNAISGTLIQDSGIVTTMIAANNITATKVVTNAIQTRHIADDQVTEDKLANAINTSIAAKLPLAGGTMTGDLILGDNVKVEIGSASGGDLQLYHDGSHSYIDNNKGALFIRNNVDDDDNNNIILQAKSGEYSIICDDDGAVSLYYDNVAKLATTSTGAAVSGTTLTAKTTSATANDRAGAGFTLTESSTDGSRRANMYLDADNGGFSTGDSGTYFYIEKKGGGGEVNFIQQDNADINFQTSGAHKRLTILGGGNVGIGATSPDKKLEVAGTDVVAKFTGTDANPPQIEFENSTGVQATIGLKSLHDFIIDTAGEDVHIGPNASSAGANGLMIAATGKVSIGTTSADAYLDVRAPSGVVGPVIFKAKSDQHGLGLDIQADSSATYINSNHNSYPLVLNKLSGGSVLVKHNAVISHANLDDLQVGDGSGHCGITVFSGTANYGSVAFADGNSGTAQYSGLIEYYHNDNSMRLYSSGVERIRIDSTGDIRFGIGNAALTAAEVHTFYNVSRGNNLGLYTQGADQHFSIDMWNHTGGSCNQVQFRGGGSGAVTGTITSTGNNATQYNTSSDYRLKENVDYTWDATSRLKQLKPVRFNWIDDDTNTLEDGFLAHEVSSVVPNAVRGEKDAVYTEEEASDDLHINAGDVKRQQLDHSKLVPLLVKTIQELEARIATLEG